MSNKKEMLISQFDPNGVGIENGHFMGLPFDLDTADIVIYPVPLDVTVSYGEGTSQGPKNVLDTSYQLDLYLEDLPDFWKKGIYFHPANEMIAHANTSLREIAIRHIQELEGKEIPNEEKLGKTELSKLNTFLNNIHQTIKKDSLQLLQQGKKIALLGGDHSSPYGYIQALAEQHNDFGILQIDAHCDLRKSYEGFTYSHASIFYNVMENIPQISALTQVAIRDFCEEEMNYIIANEKIQLFTDQAINRQLFQGKTWTDIVQDIIDTLPQNYYLSCDIDGLSPSLCPNTGTPVPGGLSFNQVLFLILELRKSGKECIGLDLCEVAGKGEWDGNVGARLLYQLMTLLS